MRAICLMGPTASGKTARAIALARRLPFEIINVDSAQVYRGMDIGTAKPSAAALKDTPHRLIDIRDPWETYSAGAFCADASNAIREIISAGRIPLLVGGTMLYFQALQRGIAQLPAADPALRAELDERAARKGWPALHAELQALDPVAAARLKPTDAQRIQRALEVCLLTGMTITELHRATTPPLKVDYLNIAIMPANRQILHRRIEDRLTLMLEAGFVAEVRALSQLANMSATVPAMRAVGYRQMWAHVAGELSLAEAARQAAAATRQLAKRQITWLRSWPELVTFDSLDENLEDQFDNLINVWLAEGASADISS
jgi:tRNA dimethylallyltransferase